MQIVYTGPHDAVDVYDIPNGFSRDGISRDEPTEVPDEVAKNLLRQGPANWRKVKPAAKPVATGRK